MFRVKTSMAARKFQNPAFSVDRREEAGFLIL
jgi:hypothetical protein